MPNIDDSYNVQCSTPIDLLCVICFNPTNLVLRNNTSVVSMLILPLSDQFNMFHSHRGISMQ